MRSGSVERTTNETSVSVTVNLDGVGRFEGTTGVGFFDHMLAQLARHSLIDMTIQAKGDLHIDDHHTVEDTGIALGQAIRQALGDMKALRAPTRPQRTLYSRPGPTPVKRNGDRGSPGYRRKPVNRRKALIMAAFARREPA